MIMNYNHFYAFRYKAKGEGKLEVYDKTPLIIILDIQGDSILGLNFHWIPQKDRKEFYENVVEIMKKTKSVGQRQKRVRLTYQMLRKPKFRAGLSGIRLYLLEGITQLKELKPEQMDIILGRYGRYFEFRMRKVYKKNSYKERKESK